MEIPGVRDRSRTKIDTLRWLVKLLLVIPLLVIDFGRSASASVKGNIQRPSVGRLITVDSPPDGHGIFPDNNLFLLKNVGQCRVDRIPPLPLQCTEVSLVEILYQSLRRICPGITFRIVYPIIFATGGQYCHYRREKEYPLHVHFFEKSTHVAVSALLSNQWKQLDSNQ